MAWVTATLAAISAVGTAASIKSSQQAAKAINNQTQAQRQIELRVVPKIIGHQNTIHFSVTDSGKGLPPEVMNRLYEAFFSTKAEGMGIGLNLCRTIVESHQGRITAENIYNADQVVGCCFSFWLPADSTFQH